MNGRVRLILKELISFKLRQLLKRYKRKVSNWIKRGNLEKTTLEDIEALLMNDLNISEGDNLIISSSFGNLNADFSPKELIELLQHIVGNEGNIVMPFYPPGNSYEWAESGKIFDMQHTKSSMGVLTQVFSEMHEVYKSKHPTKAVVAWGKDAREIVSGHENAKTPFYWDSPYGWLLKHPSKSMGLGVPNRPIIHTCEDVLKIEYNYLNDVYELEVCDEGKTFKVKTFIHDPLSMKSLKENDDLLKGLNLDSFKKVNFGFSFCYVFENQELLKKLKNYWVAK